MEPPEMLKNLYASKRNCVNATATNNNEIKQIVCIAPRLVPNHKRTITKEIELVFKRERRLSDAVMEGYCWAGSGGAAEEGGVRHRLLLS
ncbi:unnamed protein product [Dovyalis caffra]|uniref:Uncharacterized protein n=1 Tax=Dovyalis caffra TaxID=77055 RepID=A0AAV1RGZ0_9ROSI|nr:unnamed protein product [Dovyalis caffra]